MGSKTVKFIETTRRAAPAPVRGATTRLAPPENTRDRIGWALYWSEQCSTAMVEYVEGGNPYALDYAVMSARMMWHHVCRHARYHYWDESKGGF